MAFARALGLIQSVTRATGQDQDELYRRGQCFTVAGEEYNVQSVIAKGGFGTVFLVDSVKKRSPAAVKILLSHDQATSSDIENEIKLIRKFKHQNVIELYGEEKSARAGSQRVAEYRIAMEYCRWSVADILPVLRSNEKLNQGVVLKIVYFTCEALIHLHAEKVTHRDVKAENLLINSSGVLKLCDFGSATSDQYDLSKLSNDRRLALQEQMFKYTTPITRAPEVCDIYSNFPIGIMQDIWAMGCLIYFVCFGEHPFDGAQLAIINGKYKQPAKGPMYIFYEKLIQKCLVPDPSHRVTAEELQEAVEDLEISLQTRSMDTPFVDILAFLNKLEAEYDDTTSSTSTSMNVLKEKLFTNFNHLKNTVNTMNLGIPQMPRMRPQQSSMNENPLIFYQITRRLYIASPVRNSSEIVQAAYSSISLFFEDSNYFVINMTGHQLRNPSAILQVNAVNYLESTVLLPTMKFVQTRLPHHVKVVIFAVKDVATTSAMFYLDVSRAVSSGENFVNEQISGIDRLPNANLSFLRHSTKFFKKFEQSEDAESKNVAELKILKIGGMRSWTPGDVFVRVKSRNQCQKLRFTSRDYIRGNTLIFNLNGTVIANDGLITLSKADRTRVLDIYVNSDMWDNEGQVRSHIPHKTISCHRGLEQTNIELCLRIRKQKLKIPFGVSNDLCFLDQQDMMETRKLAKEDDHSPPTPPALQKCDVDNPQWNKNVTLGSSLDESDIELPFNESTLADSGFSTGSELTYDGLTEEEVRNIKEYQLQVLHFSMPSTPTSTFQLSNQSALPKHDSLVNFEQSSASDSFDPFVSAPVSQGSKQTNLDLFNTTTTSNVTSANNDSKTANVGISSGGSGAAFFDSLFPPNKPEQSLSTVNSKNDLFEVDWPTDTNTPKLASKPASSSNISSLASLKTDSFSFDAFMDTRSLPQSANQGTGAADLMKFDNLSIQKKTESPRRKDPLDLDDMLSQTKNNLSISGRSTPRKQ